MSAPVQLTPTLTIIEDEGEFIVQVGAQANASSLAQALVPLIAQLGGARKLSLVTPSGIKSFKFNSESFKFNGVNGNTPLTPASAAAGPQPAAARRALIPDAGAPPSEEDAAAEFERYTLEQQEADRVAAEMSRVAQADPHIPQPEAEPAPLKRKKNATEPIAPNNPCGRCGGGGKLPGGGTCPVCRGKGAIAKWGGRKR